MIKNKPLLIKQESSSSGAADKSTHRSASQHPGSSGASEKNTNKSVSGTTERTLHRSANPNPNPNPNAIGRIISQLGGIEGVLNTIERLQKAAQSISPILLLLNNLIGSKQTTRNRKSLTKRKKRTQRKK